MREEEEKKNKGADTEAEEKKKREEEWANRPKQEDETKCWKCEKKVGLLGVQCRCGYFFCKHHRLPEEHACDWDYKDAGRKILEKQNNKVEADKMGDRI